MKLIKPKFEIWEQGQGLDSLYKHIERCGRICYKSEDKITEDSAKPFIDSVLLKRGHYSPLEHGTVYLRVPEDSLLRNFLSNTPTLFEYPWCKVNPIKDSSDYVYITTNYRHIIENKLEDMLKYLCEPTEFHEKRITVKFILSRSIAQEYTRHRVFSFAMESQRYCNYSRDKFNNEVAFIIPCWLGWKEEVIHRGDFEKSGSGSVDSGLFINLLLDSEESYLKLLEEGWKPQQAREVLPNACKTELVMTGFVSQWKDFFLLRSNKYGKGGAHPSANELATPLYEEFVKREYIK